MAVLRMQTDVVRSVKIQLTSHTQNLTNEVDILVQSGQQLNEAWQAGSSEQFANELQILIGQLRQLTSAGINLAVQLEKEVIQWEETAQTFGGSSTGVVGNIPPVTAPPTNPISPPTPPPIIPPTPNPTSPPNKWDGHNPAPGTSPKPWLPVDAPVQNQIGERHSQTYEQVINQFGVGTNSRYEKNSQGKGETYCNIFVWDVTKAMGAEIPHWVDKQGNPVSPGVSGSRELSANGSIGWLESHGQSNGWKVVSADEAQRLANLGQPTVATWKNPSGIGHIGMVRPGELNNNSPALAQAGSKNFNSGTVRDGFGNRPVVYYVHD